MLGGRARGAAIEDSEPLAAGWSRWRLTVRRTTDPAGSSA